MCGLSLCAVRLLLRHLIPESVLRAPKLLRAAVTRVTLTTGLVILMVWPLGAQEFRHALRRSDLIETPADVIGSPEVPGVFPARFGPIHVALDTFPFIAKRARIYVRFLSTRDDTSGPYPVVRWRARNAVLTSGEAVLGERRLVFEGLIARGNIDEILDVEARAPSRLLRPFTIRMAFDVELEGGTRFPIPLRWSTSEGASLFAELQPFDMRATWPVNRDPASPPKRQPSRNQAMASSMQPSGRGIRLQTDWAGRRIGLNPEITTQNGISIGGVLASTLPRGSAGLLFVVGTEKREFLLNGVWKVSPTARLTVTGTQLRERLTIPFESGAQDVSVAQYAGGIGYQLATDARGIKRVDVNGYASRSASHHLGQGLLFRRTAVEDALIEIPLRVAGGSIFGFQARGSFQPVPAAVLGVTLGGERLEYDLSAGRERAGRITTGAEWTQSLSNGYRVTAAAGSYAALRTYSVALTRALMGQQYGLTVTSIRGRDGAPHDTQLRWNHTFTWGQDSAVPDERGTSVPGPPAYDGREMLDLATTRPAFIPAQVIARADSTVTGTRLAALAREGLPPGTRVDANTAAVTLSDPVATIVLVTRNGVPFDNVGQFVVSNNRLEVRPTTMEPPPPTLIDEYVVTLENVDGGVTTVTLTVSAGSVRIDRITVTTAERRDAPDAFAFEHSRGVSLNTLVTSNGVTIRGINVPVLVSMTGGEYALNDGAFTTAPGSVIDGQTLRVRHRSASTTATTTTTVLTVGRTVASFSSVTETDTSPNPFSFAAVGSVQPGQSVTSDTVVITGIDGPVPVSIVGGEYAIDGGPFTGSPGTISNAQHVRVRVTASANFATTTSASLTVGGIVAAFTVTTVEKAKEAPVEVPESPDSTPDPFSFSAQTNAERGTAVVSNAITVSSINTAANISISGGTYSINGDPYSAIRRTVANGQTVRVQVITSSETDTTTTATLTIGGVSAGFSVTTGAGDTTPGAFSLTAQTNVEPNTVVVSNTITASGIDAPTAISVSGGEYAVNGGSYTTAAATVSSGQTVTVRQTSSASFSTTTTATLTIGGVSAGFNVTTRAADTTPDAFSFTAQTNAALNTFIVSNAITVSGIEAATAITVSGGDYSINGGGYTSSAGVVSNGQTVILRQRSANQISTASTATLTIGGVSGTFSVTTAAPDTTPDAFSFTSQSNVAVNTAIVSNTVTISGINSASPVSISGGEYATQGNNYTSGSGTIDNGGTIKVRVTSSSSFSTTTTATVTIGGVSATFSVTTQAIDTTPDAFTFTPETNVVQNLTRMSNAITVSGINSPASISVSGASSSEYKINNGSWTSSAGTVNNGDTVRVRHTSASTPSTSTSTTLTIGGVTGTFTTTTKP